MPLTLQGKILRLVQERQFERVGGLQTLSVDVRVVAATNRDLRALVEQKLFREDLFFRLSVMPIEIPPLGGAAATCRSWPRRSCSGTRARWGGRTCASPRRRKRALAAHSWPGNVRELSNCLERAAILCDGSVIEPAHLRLEPGLRGGPSLADVLDLSGPLADVRERAAERAEEEAIALAMRDANGDRAAAAARLGVSLSTLGRRLRDGEESSS